MQAIRFEAEINNGQVTIPIGLLEKLQSPSISHHKKNCYVVLKEETYQHLLAKTESIPKTITWELLLNKSHPGERTKSSCDAQLKEERESWDK
jgi:hypothetical protein